MPDEKPSLFDIQYLKPETIVIGVTGSLSSGCTTIAEYLEKDRGFVLKRLSDNIRSELEKDDVKKPSPKQLQDKGDELRKINGNDFLVKLVFKGLLEKKPDKIVIDGIRNPGEIKYLRKFSNFFLIALDGAREERLKRFRLKTDPKISDQEFYNDIDERDSGKNQPPYGQNVTRCIDLADFQIINDVSWENDLTIRDNLFKKVDLLLDLINEPGSKLPSTLEIGMHFAYSASLLSPCLKRQVGATIARRIGSEKELAIAIGYNGPPTGIKTCYERYKDCYRDVLKNKAQEKIKEKLGGLGFPVEPGIKIFGSFLSDPEFKQLDYCQAVHAEESAILQIAKLGGTSLEDTNLYTTTFPCLMCAKKIIQTGISKIVYNEAYPSIEAKELLLGALGNENLVRFEGVKALAFFKLFQPGSP